MMRKSKQPVQNTPLPPILDVYVAEIPQNTKLGKVYPKERQKAIEDCGSEKVQRERYYVWKLLEYALKQSLGLKFKKVKFEESANGKWRCDACWFSLSHSKNAVAVAVSRKTVGVDIELYKPERMNGFAPRILNEKEKSAFDGVPETEQNAFLMQKWTEKESIYKCLDVPRCSAISMDTTATKTFTSFVKVGGEKFLLSVASDCGEIPNYYEQIDLTNI